MRREAGLAAAWVLGGLVIDVLVWAFDRFGVHVPRAAIIAAAVASAIAVLIAGAICVRMIWRVARECGRGKQMGIVLIASGVFLFCAGAAILYLENEGPIVARGGHESEPSALPKVLLSYEVDRLVLHNRGQHDLYFWGDKFGSHAPDIQEKGRRVSAVGRCDLYLEPLRTWALDAIGEDGQKSVPLDMYLTDGTRSQKFTGKFALLIRMRNGEMAVEPRTLAVTRQPW
jgi:hypothetical protein